MRIKLNRYDIDKNFLNSDRLTLFLFNMNGIQAHPKQLKGLIFQQLIAILNPVCAYLLCFTLVGLFKNKL